MSQKPSIPRGTRDFSPPEMLRRNFIFDVIRRNFSLFGYLPLETPAMENLSTLLGKYGEEGDRLIFRILNSGDFLANINPSDISAAGSTAISQLICEKGLRYDLTVPFARFVVQHRDEITFPFRRYQIQPVWRADKPQKGRYREFFQCDVDVIGSNSLLNELELIQIIDRIFSELKIRVTIRINNRKILAGIAEMAGEKERITDITVAVDKLDRIGKEGVRQELLQRGIASETVARLEPLFSLSGTASAKLGELKNILSRSEEGLKGIAEMEEIFEYLAVEPVMSAVELDLSLARGLNYYTGAIIEVRAEDALIGSVCGGGRYDDLTGIFGLPGVSGVGVSFGADRIYDVMLMLDLFPAETGAATEALVVNFGREELPELLKLIRSLREAGIPSELYPESVKLKKQFAYADARKIPWVIIAGSEEIASLKATVKEMKTGAQTTVSLSELPEFIKSGKAL
ncbi:MAG: histidine--tRNA ligase [Bacteroidales bacterium]